MSETTNQSIIVAWSSAAAHPEQFGDEGDFARQHLLNPAIVALLGDVAGKHVLDAGCGQGYLSRLLAKRGAVVTGVEPAEGWLRYAREREAQEPLGITYVQRDLSSFAMRESFDAAVANMVFMDIPDYQAAMRNSIAALRLGGRFIFSLQHPCFEEPSANWPEKRYVEVREYLREYVAPQPIGSLFHRPLSSYLNLLANEGCVLRRVIEPRLDPALAAQNPTHERNVHVPSFIVIAADKS